MKTPDLSLSQLTKMLSQFLYRFHVMIFTLVVLGGLSVATFMLYTTITSTQPSTDTVVSNSAFDKQTMDKINNLRSTDDTSEPLTLPAGRTNPFQ